MKSVSNILFLIVILTATFSCSRVSEKTSPDVMPDFDQLKQEVNDMFTLSMELFRNKDLDGLVNRFAEDGTLKLPGAPLLKGHQALRENYAVTIELEDFNINLNVTKIEVSLSGDMAYALADFEVSFLTPSGIFSDSGHALMVLKRWNDEWKIAAEYLSSDPSN